MENRNALITLVKSTGNRSIVECTKDTVWGCRIVLQDDKCLIKTEWTNQGIMGEILETIRNELAYLVQDQTATDNHSSDNSSQSSSSEESGDKRDKSDNNGDLQENMIT